MSGAYCAARPLLFALPPETAHCLAMAALEARLKLLGVLSPPNRGGRKAMGLEFPNPIGLAAGMDKNGARIDALGNLGFGFIEIGCATPLPQDGNRKPRLFRLPAAKALINRMGFNNVGAARIAENLRRRRYAGVVGVNIGKNAATGDDGVIGDYLRCLEELYAGGDFFTVNISSPNTPGLRDWQHGEKLTNLLAAVADKRDELADKSGRRAALAVKIAPDLGDEAILRIAAAAVGRGYDGIIACNTTLARPAETRGLRGGDEAGGLSGRPLAARATEVIRLLRGALPAETAIIGVGGIFTVADANEKLAAGADLLQIYTGLIYRGAELPMELIRGVDSPSAAENNQTVGGLSAE